MGKGLNRWNVGIHLIVMMMIMMLFIDSQDKRLEMKKKQGKAAVLGPVFPIPEGDENK